MVRGFANSLGDVRSIPGRVIPKTQNWYLMPPCLILSIISVAFSYTCPCRIYTYICWIHTDAMNNRRRKSSLTKYLPLILLQGFKRGYSKFACEKELETEHNWNILTPNLWPSVLCLSCSSDAQPGPWGPFCWVLAFFTASYQHLLLTLIQSGLLTAPSAGRGFPYQFSLQLSASPLDRRTQLSYIIVRRPLDLWNRMFNRHQAEITVMQFRGHSLPVHHSVVAQWDLHLVPYYQP